MKDTKQLRTDLDLLTAEMCKEIGITLDITEMKRTKYEVEIGKEWCKCTRATETGTGWLHYELSDGTIGLKRPGTWRVKA